MPGPYSPPRQSRLPPDLDARFLKRAAADGVRPARLVRRAIEAYLSEGGQAVALPSSFVDELKATRADLARIGGNLNQLAHAFNVDGPRGFDAHGLAGAHDELRQEFRRLMQLLQEIEKHAHRA